MSLRLRLALFGGLVAVASLLMFGLLIYWLSAATQASDQDKALGNRAGEAARGISRGNGPTIAWFKDPAGNILSVLEAA